MAKFKLIIFFIIGISSIANAKIKTNLSNEINKLNELGKNILAAENDEDKLKINQDYKTALKDLINLPNSFDSSFTDLKTISILKANKLKIYNWTIPFTDGTFEYFAFLQIKTDKGFSLVELTDKSEGVKSPENKILTPKSWYGALYYKIIHHKKLGENTYTLLGWDGNNMLTNKKIIDVVTISGNGMIKFGSPIFKMKNKVQRRVIFEYSKEVVMSLKYHPEVGKIIFDHLVPASSKLVGVYEYYGPALKIFDAFYIEKGKWIYEKDTDIKLDRNIKDHMWVDPKGK